MKKRLLVLAFVVAAFAGGMVADTAPAFAAQKERVCKKGDTEILVDANSPAELQKVDHNGNGRICERFDRKASYYDV